MQNTKVFHHDSESGRTFIVFDSDLWFGNSESLKGKQESTLQVKLQYENAYPNEKFSIC
jgi:hypothetical protein